MSDYISGKELLKHQYRIDDSVSLSTRDVVNVEDIEDCPSADVRENIHGTWMKINPIQSDDGGAYCCSVCGSGDYNINPNTWKGCPWCLAIMDSADMRGEKMTREEAVIPELNLKYIIAESRDVAKALNEFTNELERIEKKYTELLQAESEEEKE